MVESKWFNYCIENGKKANFFCFPHAGSGASVYAAWGDIISQYFNYFPIQYPMRENRRAEKMPASIKELAESIAKENIATFREKPCIFFGQCLGALIAFETIIALNKLSVKTPSLIIAAGCPSPGTSFVSEFSEQINNSDVAEYFVKLGYISKEVAENKMYLDFFMPVLRSDYFLMQNYKADKGERIDCSVMTVYGQNDTEVNDVTLNDWKKYTNANVLEKKYEGGHFCINDSTLKNLLEEIKIMI